MNKYRKCKPMSAIKNSLVSVAGIAAVLVAGAVYAGSPIRIAEYRADHTPLTHRPAEAINPDLELSSDISPTARDSSLLRSIAVGTYVISSGLDYRFREALSDRGFDELDGLTVASKPTSTPSRTMHLYHGFTRDGVSELGYRYNPSQALDVWRSGLAQVWNLAPWQAQIVLGYEFERGKSSDHYDGLRGHSLNVQGRFPLWWGFEANLEAGFSRQSYAEFGGQMDLASDRRSLSAGIGRSFTERLQANLQFMYADEDFEESPMSYSRQTWGLNLRYDY